MMVHPVPQSELNFVQVPEFCLVVVQNTTWSRPLPPTTTSSAVNTSTSLSVAFTGAHPGDYAPSATICGSSLASGAKCSISMSFTTPRHWRTPRNAGHD
jgi:hypothetical protein